jgi:hypothetical protein
VSSGWDTEELDELEKDVLVALSATDQARGKLEHIMKEVIDTATSITRDTFKQLEDHIKTTDEMVTELRILLERKEKLLQSVCGCTFCRSWRLRVVIIRTCGDHWTHCIAHAP